MPVRIVQTVPIMTLFTMFSMRGHETQIFQLLMRKPMTIKQLQKASHMSERMLRTYLDDLTRRNLVAKRVIEDQRLKYMYYANPPDMIINMAKDAINKIAKFNKELYDEIMDIDKGDIKKKVLEHVSR